MSYTDRRNRSLLRNYFDARDTMVVASGGCVALGVLFGTGVYDAVRHRRFSCVNSVAMLVGLQGVYVFGRAHKSFARTRDRAFAELPWDMKLMGETVPWYRLFDASLVPGIGDKRDIDMPDTLRYEARLLLNPPN